ncbi:hypothetical protein SynBIOSE41_03775 [Synechococcus sp. BIOS-E4-1]|nr:hypothetical protein [Synechococcus sp. BIOS-E4-1]QNI56244.1 hypothetical protein SynBIOSE41_03775 [Synechococcus sp. BIOS-E4-1]
MPARKHLGGGQPSCEVRFQDLVGVALLEQVPRLMDVLHADLL